MPGYDILDGSMDQDIDLKIMYQKGSKRRSLATFCCNLNQGTLRLRADRPTELEMMIMIAFLRDCADAMETELNNGYCEIKH